MCPDNTFRAEARKAPEDKHKLKVEVLGLKKGQASEVRILNKIVRMSKAGIELEADPRHVELPVRELQMEDAKITSVPGAKPVKTTTKKIDATDDHNNNDDDMGINSVQSAPMSDGDKILEMPKVEGERESDEDDPQLGPEDARLYRGVAARFNDLAPSTART